MRCGGIGVGANCSEVVVEEYGGRRKAIAEENGFGGERHRKAAGAKEERDNWIVKVQL